MIDSRLLNDYSIPLDDLVYRPKKKFEDKALEEMSDIKDILLGILYCISTDEFEEDEEETEEDEEETEDFSTEPPKSLPILDKLTNQYIFKSTDEILKAFKLVDKSNVDLITWLDLLGENRSYFMQDMRFTKDNPLDISFYYTPDCVIPCYTMEYKNKPVQCPSTESILSSIDI